MTFPRASLFAAIVLLATAPAGATTVKTGKPAASQPSPRAWATRDQLRDCLDTEDALKQRFKGVEALTDAHEKLFNQVEAEGTQLETLQADLDHDSETAIRAFNALVKDHNVHVKALNQDAADTQPVTKAYNADMAAYNHRCAALVYRVEDMDAVMRERRKAAALGAASAASGTVEFHT